MKKSSLTAVALFLAVSTSLLAAEKTKAAGPDFKDMMRKTLDAWETLDAAKAAPFYATDEKDLAFFDVEPMKYTGWNEYAEGTKKVFADFSAMRIALNADARSELKGNIAWGTATVHLDVTQKKDASRLSLDGRWTLIWEKKGGKWLIVHEHLSVPLPPPCPPAAPAAKKPGAKK